ncbi:eukaryotic translation initiation factor 2-alpha kinase 3-like isoform X1 [Arapaima gigas]
MSKGKLDARICAFLRSCEPGVQKKALDIAKGVGLKTAKDVNSTLYSLMKAGQLSKTESTPPLWSLVSPDSQTADREGSNPMSGGPQLGAQGVSKSQTGNTSLASRESQDRRGLEEFSSVEMIDEGGFGCIFKAKNEVDGKWYAVKIVGYSGDNEKREVQILAKLEHPNIVRYYTSWIGPPYQQYSNNHDNQQLSSSSAESSGSIEFENPNFASYSVPSLSDKTPDEEEESESCSQSIYSDMTPQQVIATSNRCLYIQMEFCEGGSLTQWFRDEGKDRTREEAVRIFKQIVEGVAYIHSQNHIHRDLKPDNILFKDKKTIKIGDFGLVTHICDEKGGPIYRTKKKGTESYMSPEQEDNSCYTEKTDIFPLGLIFFELLWILKTNTERAKIWKDLRNRKFPKDYHDQYTAEQNLIREMLSPEPDKRPKASSIRGLLNVLNAKPRTF